MPRVREYTSESSVQAGIPGRRAQTSDLGGTGQEELGRALMVTGADVARTGRYLDEQREKLERKREQDETIEIERQVAAARNQWTEDFLKRQKEAPPGAAGFTEKFKEDFDKYQETVVGETNLSDRGKARLGNHMQNLRASLIDNAVRFEVTASAAASRAAVDGIFDQNTNAVRANPAALTEVIEQEKRLVGGLVMLNEQERAKLLRARIETVSDAALDGSIDLLQQMGNIAEIRAFADHLRKNKTWQAEASPAGYARALDRLQRLDEHFSAKNNKLDFDALNERIAEASAGVANGLSVKEAGFISDPVERTRAEKKIEAAVRTGDAVRSVATVSHGDLVELIQKDSAAVQKPGDFGADAQVARARVAAASDRLKALNDDPAAYVMKNSEPVAAAYKKMAENPDDPMAVRDYVAAMTTEQQRLAPWQGTRLLSADQVGQVKMQMADVPSTPEGADTALQNLIAMQKTWGSAWPTVRDQLVKDEALNGVQAAASRMTDPTKQAAARLLLQAAAMPRKDLEKFIDQPNFDRDLKTATNQVLEPFYRAMDFQVAGDVEKRRMFQAVETLAIGYITRGEKDIAKAVQRAASEVVMNDFHWQGTYFVPKNVNPDHVAYGTRTVLANLEKHEFALPTDLAGLRDVDTRKGAIDALRAGGVWVTNADATGVALTWPNSGGYGRRERVMVNRDGKRVPFEFTWDQLKQMYVEGTAPDPQELMTLGISP